MAETLETLIAKKDALDTKLDSIERWAIFFAIIVGIGVCGEAAYSVRAWWNNRKLHVVQQSIDQFRQAEIARLDIERLKLEAKLAPRFLTPEQGQRLSDRLRSSRVKLAALYVYGATPEIVRLSKQIGDALKRAGWNFEGWSVTGTGTVAGILVDVRDSSGLDTTEAATLLVRGFEEVDLNVTLGPPYAAANAMPGMLVGPAQWTPDKYSIRIHIGPKP